MTTRSTIRLAKEYRQLHTSSDLLSAHEENLRKMRTMIIGPPSTPYEFGFFEFEFAFPDTYPDAAPSVRATTTNRGRTRFNPNIYANGRVCLSILGTWPGEKGEEWSPCQNLETTLISIQSLLCADPYQNEPGFETPCTEEKKEAEAYADKIRHESLRISVIERLENALGIKPADAVAVGQCEVIDAGRKTIHVPANPKVEEASSGIVIQQQSAITPHPIIDAASADVKDEPDEPFEDLCKRRFLWYYDNYVDTVQTEGEKHKSGSQFRTARFEHLGNSMRGSYMYPSLLKRLYVIRKALDDETIAWSHIDANGLGVVATTRAMLRSAFDQASVKSRNGLLDARCEISLEQDNPLVWNLLLFGQPCTNLDGAVVSIVMHFPPSFPDAQPRVAVKTPLFHHRISKTGGVLCYTAEDTSVVLSHIKGIFHALEDDDPTYDPRTLVHKEAATLLHGDAAAKKQYGRRLRRSVQDSLDSLDT